MGFEGEQFRALKDTILYGTRDTQCFGAYVFYGKGKSFKYTLQHGVILQFQIF